MKTIAIMNQKGGVGKTMTAASVAYILGAEQGKKVLIVDADQQGNISMLYNRFDPEGKGTPELLEDNQMSGGNYSTETLIQHTEYDNIDIIPANGYLMRTNMQLLMLEQGDQIFKFRRAMEEVQLGYDYCIVDCGLIMDMAVTNVLVGADLVIAPVKIGGFEIEAVDNMEEQLDTIRNVNPDIHMKVLMTMCQKNRTTMDVLEWMTEISGHECYKTIIRRSVVAEKSTMAHVPLPRFSRGCIAAQDYREVTRKILEDMEG